MISGNSRGLRNVSNGMPPSASTAASAGPFTSQYTRPFESTAGQVNSGHKTVSVARMISPSGWEEPGQRPEFDEYTIVLEGTVRVEHEGGGMEVKAGQAVLTRRGEWVRYSTPQGAQYIAVCLPAFSPNTVHRDA